MDPNVRMQLKSTILFALFASISCTLLKEEIDSIYLDKCKGKPEDIAPLGLEICEISVDAPDTVREKLPCIGAKEVMLDICNETNTNVKFVNVVASMKELANVTDFCSNRSIQESTKVPASVSSFIQIIKNTKQCGRRCLDDTEHLLPLCQFLISYHKLQSKGVPHPVKNDSQSPPVPKSQSHAEISKDTTNQVESKIQNVNSSSVKSESKTNEKGTASLPNPSSSPKPPQTQLNNRESPNLVIKQPNIFPIPELKAPTEKAVINRNPEINPSDDNEPPPPLMPNEPPPPPLAPNAPNDPDEIEDNHPDGIEPQGNDYDNMEVPKKTDANNNNQFSIVDDLNKNIKSVEKEKIQPPFESPFEDSKDSHFFFYFVFISALCIFFYVAMYNKKKILALLIEGRRSNVKRRPNSAAYSKLDCNLEEAMTSGPSTSSSNTLLY